MSATSKIERLGVLFSFAVSILALAYFITEGIYYIGWALTGGLVMSAMSLMWFSYLAVKMLTRQR